MWTKRLVIALTLTGYVNTTSPSTLPEEPPYVEVGATDAKAEK